MKKKITLPMKFEMTNEMLNENFHKVKLYVCHNGENYNGSSFSDLAIAKASKTLQNIPILAYIERDEEGNALGFGGHEVEYQIVENEYGELIFKEHYLEVPIGVIPSQNDYSIETINNRNYVCCTGYIWKCYSNEAYDILLANNEQSVSMEISVIDGKFVKDGIYDISDYEYLGVTVLGLDVEPAMANAKIQMSFSHNNEYQEKVRELDILLQEFVKGGDNVENKKEFEEEIVEEVEQQEFEEEEEKEEVCPQCNKPLSECQCENDEEFEKHDETSITDYISSEKLYTQAEVDEMIANTKTEFSDVLNELAELREFKAKYDKEIELQKLNNSMDEILVNFNVEEELVQKLREKVVNGEYSLEKFELELYRNNIVKKEFNKEEKKNNSLPIMDREEERMSEVDRLFAQFGIPKRK